MSSGIHVPPEQQPPSGQQPPTSPPPQPPKRRRLKAWHWVLIGLGVVIVVAILASALNQGSQPTTTTSPTVTSQPTTAPTATTRPSATNTPAAPTATSKPTYAQFGNGTFQVGTDIQPGTYRTREGASGCYWARLSGFGGTLDEIIANNTTNAPAVVTIAASDKGFESQRCGTWTKDLSQITQSTTSFGAGTYIVGTDMVPGTYKSSGGQACYWARLSGFGGTLDEIIANGNPSGATIVNIAASDKGFESHGCGTWTKQ